MARRRLTLALKGEREPIAHVTEPTERAVGCGEVAKNRSAIIMLFGPIVYGRLDRHPWFKSCIFHARGISTGLASPHASQTHARQRGPHPSPIDGAMPAPDVSPEIASLRKKLATLRAINEALRDENDALRAKDGSNRGASSSAVGTNHALEQQLTQQLREADEVINSLTRQRDELEEQVEDKSSDDAGIKTKLKVKTERVRERDLQLQAKAREVGKLERERRKQELTAEDAQPQRENALNKLKKNQEQIWFANEAASQQQRADDAASLINLRRRLTVVEKDFSNERQLFRQQLDAATDALHLSKAQFGKELQAAELRARASERTGGLVHEAIAEAVAEQQAQVQSATREAKEAKAHLKKSMLAKEAVVSALEGKLAQTEAKLSEATQSIRTTQIEHGAVVEALRQRVRDADSELCNFEAGVSETTLERATLQESLLLSDEKRLEAEQKLKAVEAELVETRVDRERLVRELNKALDTINRLDREVRERDNEKKTDGDTERSVVGNNVSSKEETGVTQNTTQPPLPQTQPKPPNSASSSSQFGFDVGALVRAGSTGGENETWMNGREKRLVERERAARQTVVQQVLVAAEAQFQERLDKAHNETANVKARLEKCEHMLAELASLDEKENDNDGKTHSCKSKLAADTIRAEVTETREAYESLMTDHETLLEVLGEKTETVEALQRQVDLLTDLKNKKKAMDDVRKDSSHPGKSAFRERYVKDLTHARFTETDRGVDRIVDEW